MRALPTTNKSNTRSTYSNELDLHQNRTASPQVKFTPTRGYLILPVHFSLVDRFHLFLSGAHHRLLLFQPDRVGSADLPPIRGYGELRAPVHSGCAGIEIFQGHPGVHLDLRTAGFDFWFVAGTLAQSKVTWNRGVQDCILFAIRA